MKTDKLPLADIIWHINTYNEQNTRFQVPADIYCHSAHICPQRAAIVRLEALDKYWQNHEQTTLFFIWHEENMKVWNDILYEWEFKQVIKISAENDKIKEFKPITTEND